MDPEPIPGPPAPKREALEERLPTQARANPDLTLEEHCELFEEESGMEVSTAYERAQGPRWLPPRTPHRRTKGLRVRPYRGRSRRKVSRRRTRSTTPR